MANNSLTKGLRPAHPGELLREEVLPALGRPTKEIAELLGVSRQTLYDIMKGKKPVTVEMALRFGKLFGNGPDLWIRMQQAYDQRIAERKLAAKLAKIPTLTSS